MLKVFLSLVLVLPSTCLARKIRVAVNAPAPQIDYALEKLASALRQQGDTLLRDSAGSPDLRVRHDDPQLGDEGFAISRQGQALVISSGRTRGAMYGVLEVAEQIRLGTPFQKVEPRHVSPHMSFRAIKFNLPFAAYRTSPALEQHAVTCRDLNFWRAFLDMMAENRFNTLTLWSMHPFHYMVRPRNFPEASPFNEAEMAEWHRLWTGIFAMAKERGIETYLLNWNIFVSPEFARAHNLARWSESWSHYGQESTTNEIVVRYTQEVVTQVINEYPDLTGLGITLGERMGGMTPAQRRAWLDDTFFAGIAAANRPVKFIYRAPLSANTGSGGTTSEENDRLTRKHIESLTNNVIQPIYVEFKHNWSHAHSSPDLFIVHGGKLSDAYWNPAPTRHKVVWTMRNEDFFVLRWGQPDFIRKFEQNYRQDHVAGALIGSECYIPALDYITSEGPHKTWEYAFQRQWLFYSTWGRLLYDAATPDTRFQAMFDERFGPGTGKHLLPAWKLASQVPLHFASFHRGEWDGSLYTEGFSSWRDNAQRTLFDINSFIRHPVLDTKRYINIADFVKSGRVPSGAFSPTGLADQLDRDCAATLRVIDRLSEARKKNPTLDCEVTDIEAWCAFGNYFACKLRAGYLLETARSRKDSAHQERAVIELQKAVTHWKRLSDLGSRFNNLPVPSNSRGPFSWAALTPEVERDIELAKAPLQP